MLLAAGSQVSRDRAHLGHRRRRRPGSSSQHDEHMLWISARVVVGLGLRKRRAYDGPPLIFGRQALEWSSTCGTRCTRTCAAVVRVLRPASDRAADVARDGRPAAGAVLPRLRAHLLLPARPDLLGVTAVMFFLEMAAAVALAFTPDPGARVPVQPRRRTRSSATCSRRWRTSRRWPRRTSSASTSSSRSRRSRREQTKFERRPRRVRPQRPEPTGSARSTCRCWPSCRCWVRPRCCCSAAGWSSTARSASATSSASTSCRCW